MKKQHTFVTFLVNFSTKTRVNLGISGDGLFCPVVFDPKSEDLTGFVLVLVGGVLSFGGVAVRIAVTVELSLGASGTTGPSETGRLELF